MNKLLLMTMILLSSTFLFANTSHLTCSSVMMSNNKSKCDKVMLSGHISPLADKLCSIVMLDDPKIECLKVSLNKEYTSSDTDYCSRSMLNRGKIDCMETHGKSYKEEEQLEVVEEFSLSSLSAEMRLQQIKKVARRIKRQLKVGYFAEALVNIALIIELATFDDY